MSAMAEGALVPQRLNNKKVGMGSAEVQSYVRGRVTLWPGKGEIESIRKKVLQSHWEQRVGITCKRNKALEGRFGAILQGL